MSVFPERELLRALRWRYAADSLYDWRREVDDNPPWTSLEEVLGEFAERAAELRLETEEVQGKDGELIVGFHVVLPTGIDMSGITERHFFVSMAPPSMFQATKTHQTRNAVNGMSLDMVTLTIPALCRKLCAILVEVPGPRVEPSRTALDQTHEFDAADLLRTYKGLSDEDRSRAEHRVVLMGSAAVPLVLPLLSDRDAHVANRSTRVLAQIGDASAVEPLIAALESDGPRLSSGWASLARFRDERSLRLFLSALDGDFGGDVATIVAQAVQHYPHPSLVPAVLGVLTRATKRDATLIILALGKIGDARALPALRRAAADATTAQAADRAIFEIEYGADAWAAEVRRRERTARFGQLPRVIVGIALFALLLLFGSCAWNAHPLM